ncbi:MAG: TVP38/TMEM64 family protein [Anaerolineae bacterium]|nr:TVP38/TMEM64 family protein [Anaerolineae bacterium]
MSERAARAIRVAAWALAAIALVVIAVRFWRPLLGLVSEQDRLREWVAGFGSAGPLALIALQAAQVILAPLPGQVVGLVSGYLFGTFWGTVYSTIGVLLGAWILMTLARKLGRAFVERVVPPRHLRRFDDLVRRGGPTAFFILFLLPFVPDDSISILAGLTDIPISLLLILAAIGRFPSLLASAWMGDVSGNLTAGQWLALVGVALALGVPVLAYRRRLEAWVDRIAARIGRRNQ